MSSQSFAIGDVLDAGWEATKAQLGFLMVLVIVSTVLWTAPGALALAAGQGSGTGFGSSLLSYALSVLVSLGWARVGLLASAGEEASFDAFFGTVRRIVPGVIAFVLASFAVGVGFVLLVVPGIYLAVKLSLVAFVLVDDEEAGAVDALRESWRLTDGVWSELFLFYVVTGFLNVLGVVLAGLGLLLTMPLTVIAWARVYRRLAEGTAPATEAAAGVSTA